VNHILVVEEVAEFVPVLLDAAVNGNATASRGAVAVGGGITIAELGGDIGALEGDVLLILFLSVEGDDVLDRTEVRFLIMIGGSILDVMEVEVVFAGGCNRRA
jgi:hypothetical protein